MIRGPLRKSGSESPMRPLTQWVQGVTVLSESQLSFDLYRPYRLPIMPSSLCRCYSLQPPFTRPRPIVHHNHPSYQQSYFTHTRLPRPSVLKTTKLPPPRRRSKVNTSVLYDLHTSRSDRIFCLFPRILIARFAIPNKGPNLYRHVSRSA